MRMLARAPAPPDPDPGEVRWAKQFWTWWAHVFRKWTPEYWDAAKLHQSRESDGTYAELRKMLPAVLEEKVDHVRDCAPDRNWFDARDLLPLLERMGAAALLAPVFAQSKWTKWDRRTLAWSEDQGTVARSFRYLVRDLRDEGAQIDDDAGDFPFWDYEMWEIREVFDTIGMLLDSPPL